MMPFLRKFTIVLLTISLCFTTVACGGGVNKTTPTATNVTQTRSTTKLSDGEYPVQQASYNDGDGGYTLFLLNSPTPTFSTEKLQMARLTEEQIKQGKSSYLKVENGESVLYLTPDFKIEYVQNVAETRTDPQTGQRETVVVRQNNGFWAPFAGAVAGQAIGNMLFRPQYYVPPAYQPGGGLLTGFGGYGRTYDGAVSNYRQRYNEPPAVVRNRTQFRTTGNIRRSSPTTTTRTRTTGNSRASGSGFGSSKLKPSGSSSVRKRPSGSSFGSSSSSRSRSRSSSGFGSRSRGRRR